MEREGRSRSMKKTDKYLVQRSTMVAAGLLLVFVIGICSDMLFWYHYLNAYTFDTFVEKPFPTEEWLYPQETVPGVDEPRTFPYAEAETRTISPVALDAAAAFAEARDSTSLIISQRFAWVSIFWLSS